MTNYWGLLEHECGVELVSDDAGEQPPPASPGASRRLTVARQQDRGRLLPLGDEAAESILATNAYRAFPVK